jgi:CheY-like chemotaxis protein
MWELNSKFHILLVEDNVDDAYFLKRAFKQNQANPTWTFAEDGETALELLRGKQVRPPDLVILDYKLPRKNGVEIMWQIKTIPAFKELPIVIFSAFNLNFNANFFSDLPHCCYIRKPEGSEKYSEIVEKISRFYQGIAHSVN